jgi:hypothetical protein
MSKTEGQLSCHVGPDVCVCVQGDGGEVVCSDLPLEPLSLKLSDVAATSFLACAPLRDALQTYFAELDVRDVKVRGGQCKGVMMLHSPNKPRVSDV